MSELAYRKIGTNPEVEAVLLQELCSSDGIDDAILSEFSGTINSFAYNPIEESTAKIINRYTGRDPLAVGNLVMRKGQAIGVAYSGIAEFHEAEDEKSTVGINVSSWLSSHYRERGFGHKIIKYATAQAIENSATPSRQNWYLLQIWTSIRIGNIASIRACEKAGFVKSGAIYNDPDRHLYLYH